MAQVRVDNKTTMWQPPDTEESRQVLHLRSKDWNYSEPIIPGQRRYARRGSGFGLRKGSMQTGHMTEDDSNERKQQTDQAKRFSTTCSTIPPTACSGPINTTNHSELRSSHSSEVNCGLRHEGAFETVRGSGAPAKGGRISLADATTRMGRIVSRFTGNNASNSDMAWWSNHSRDESMSDASITVASRSDNNNDSSDLYTSASLGNTSGRLTLTSDANSSRLSLGDSLANITRRLSSIGTGRSKRSSMGSKRSSIDTNQDSAQERKREGGAAHGVNLADFGARAVSRRSFSVPELQDLRPAHDVHEKPARRHSSASQKDGEEMARLIVGFNGSGSFSSSGEGSMRGFLGWPKGSKSSSGVSDSDSDLRMSGNDSWQSLGSLDSLGLPAQHENDDRQQPRRRSSLVSVGETSPTHFEEGENDEAIQQLRRSSMDHSWKQS